MVAVGDRERPLVLLYIVDAGGGHRAAANALLAAAGLDDPGCDLEIKSIQDVLARLDWTRRLTGHPLEDTYNGMVRRGWTVGLVPLLRGLQWLVRQMHEPLVRMLSDDVGILAYKVRERLTVDGQPMTLEASDASTWVRRDGRWVCAMHNEAIAGDPFGRDRKAPAVKASG